MKRGDPSRTASPLLPICVASASDEEITPLSRSGVGEEPIQHVTIQAIGMEPEDCAACPVRPGATYEFP
jgi:hypothetical protein